jgi:hypothetical protein
MAGPLPKTWRLYIGIMAAAQHSCVPLAAMLRVEYLAAGGDPKWLMEGVRGSMEPEHGDPAVPKKLLALAPLSALLAHQPWRVTLQHMAQLAEPLGPGAPRATTEAWSVAELVHAVVLLSTYHALASLVYSCGLVPDIDSPGGAIFLPQDFVGNVEQAHDEESSMEGSLGDDTPSDSSLREREKSTSTLTSTFVSEVSLVSPAELSLTDQLIGRLKNSVFDSNGNEIVGAGNVIDRQAIFERCESLEGTVSYSWHVDSCEWNDT